MKAPLARKKFAAIIGILLVLLPSSVYVYAALKKPLPQPQLITQDIGVKARAPVIDWPAGVDAAVGSLTSGVLASSNPDGQPRSIASIAKVITALAIIAKRPITSTADTTITFTDADEALYRQYVAAGGSNVPVTAGLQLSEYHALEAMMLPSANNMADSLATWAFGSMENYNAYANQMVKSFGLTKTTVGSASGFDDGVLSTPSDLVVIGQKLLGDTWLSGIVKLKSDTIPGIGVITNTNQLLSADVSGIKTGHTNTAGYCLLLVKTITGQPGQTAQVISAVLGAENSAESFNVSDSLTESMKSRFSTITVANKNRIVGEYTTQWGSKSDVVSNDEINVYGWVYAARKVTIAPKHLSAPLDIGAVVGTLSARSDDGMLATGAVRLKNSIQGPSAWWRLTHYF